MSYLGELNSTFWRYVDGEQTLAAALDGRPRGSERPPVFAHGSETLNVLCSRDVSSIERDALYGVIPKERRHRWFRSMRSSQALAQSVFGNLQLAGAFPLLESLKSDEGEPVVGKRIVGLELEHVVPDLGEERGRETNIDVLLHAPEGYQVAIECKLAEDDVGACSRPNLHPEKDASYARDHCDGNYVHQRGRKERCSLTNAGIRYWKLIPQVFRWDSQRDHYPCPMRQTYQLVRNTIAVAGHEHSGSPRQGHAVLLYDARNPAFAEGGPGRGAYNRAKGALKRPDALRRCSWQRLASHLRADKQMRWLGEALQAKYGL